MSSKIITDAKSVVLARLTVPGERLGTTEARFVIINTTDEIAVRRALEGTGYVGISPILPAPYFMSAELATIDQLQRAMEMERRKIARDSGHAVSNDFGHMRFRAG